MIVDVHTHYPFGKHQNLDRIDRFIDLAQGFGIGWLCLLGDVLRHGQFPDEAQVREINDLTLELVRRRGDVLSGFCFLNPANQTAFCLEEMERCIAGAGFVGVKLENALNCRDRRLDPIMEKVRESNAAVLHHSWSCPWLKEAQPQFSNPADIADLAGRFPDVPIIMAHLTGCGIRGVLDVADHANVYVDTSGGQPVAGLVDYAVRKLGVDRVLFGSDAPGRSFAAQLGRIYGADLDETARQAILGGNARRLLRI